MNFENLLKRICILSAVFIFTAATANAQTFKGLFWADSAAEVEVYLIDEQIGEAKMPYPKFNLIVISEKNVNVVYHTEINSTEVIREQLVPVKSLKGIKYFMVRHVFGKASLWLELEFLVDGKSSDSLKRFFFNGFSESSVSNK